MGFPFAEQGPLEKLLENRASCQQCKLEIFNGNSQHVQTYCTYRIIQMQGEIDMISTLTVGCTSQGRVPKNDSCIL